MVMSQKKFQKNFCGVSEALRQDNSLAAERREDL
jgi:hypothetical protein